MQISATMHQKTLKYELRWNMGISFLFFLIGKVEHGD